MKYKLQIIDDKAHKQDIERDDPPTLEELQSWVEGPIELLHLNFHNRSIEMVVNEEGYLRGLPPNYLATTLYGSQIYGSVVLFMQGSLP